MHKTCQISFWELFNERCKGKRKKSVYSTHKSVRIIHKCIVLAVERGTEGSNKEEKMRFLYHFPSIDGIQYPHIPNTCIEEIFCPSCTNSCYCALLILLLLPLLLLLLLSLSSFALYMFQRKSLINLVLTKLRVFFGFISKNILRTWVPCLLNTECVNILYTS